MRSRGGMLLQKWGPILLQIDIICASLPVRLRRTLNAPVATHELQLLGRREPLWVEARHHPVVPLDDDVLDFTYSTERKA